MSIWNWWRMHVQQHTEHVDKSTFLLPQSRGEITPEALQDALADMDDVMTKDVSIAEESITVVYINSLVDKSILQDMVLNPLLKLDQMAPQEAFPLGEIISQDELPKLLQGIMSGYTTLLFGERNLILQLDTRSLENRSISPSESESTVIGPQDSFNESLETSISLIRRRIVSPHLKVKTRLIGTETRNQIAVLYMENIVNRENLERVLYRVKNVEYHGLVGVPILKQMLEDKPYSPFPQFGMTNRPDNAVSALLDGRILIILNGGPEAAICPSSFLEMFNSPEDFYNRWSTASLLRMIRFWGLFLSLLLTSSYVSILTFHPEMLPKALLTILSQSRSRVPFPPVIEVLIMELVIEILREAGARMPTKIGQTLGIVGGIVIGTASVQAGLASNILIVLVSVSALLSFVTPTYLMSNAIRLVRYLFILGAGCLGMFGQMLALALLFAHLINLTSLGTPYLTPGIPRNWTDLTNSLIRAPLQFIMTRSGIARAQKRLTRPLDEE